MQFTLAGSVFSIGEGLFSSMDFCEIKHSRRNLSIIGTVDRSVYTYFNWDAPVYQSD